MSDKPGASVPDSQHTPEFKLQVVLEYLRNPRRKRHIIKGKGITEELLAEWYREFLDRAEQIFGGQQAPPTKPTVKPEPSDIPPMPESAVSAATPAKAEAAPAASTWGIKLIRGRRESYHSPSSSRECPAWAGGFSQKEWEDEPGLAVWDDASKKFEHLRPNELLELWHKLSQDERWRTEGIRLTRRFEYEIQNGERKKRWHRHGKRRAQPTVDTGEPKREVEEVEEELFRLNPQASAELFELLKQHEALLEPMAEEEQKRIDKAFHEVFDLALRSAWQYDVEEVDLSKRPLPWVKQADAQTLVCDVPPNRGTVRMSKSDWFWEACIEQPDHFKNERTNFLQLEKALEWAEQELQSIQASAEAEDKQTELESGTTKSQIDLTPYRIDPAALEPARITYRAVIYLERLPEQFKTMEMSFGKLMRYDEKYPSLLKILNELKLDESAVKFEQPGGINFGWYFLFSTATYYEETVARIQVQRLWDASAIQQLYKEGKVPRARYGIEEVETGFCTWLGGLMDPEHPWEEPETRAEHIANWALEEAVVHALDVVRFREDRKLSPKLVSDEQLVHVLHERRVRSKHIPIDARAESEHWLASHPDVE
ncbi:MAG: hypothetical protein M1132_08975 [Chloroflexi bacterium]|nr:hypothetical protein [Chloroflexota bacterium]